MIYNLKPRENLRYRRVNDADEIRQARHDASMEWDLSQSDLSRTEVSEDGDNLVFTRTASSSSCRVEDIQAIIYGGQSSRFWMLRKHINTLPRALMESLPIFSWNCITLQLGHRDVDLVIRKDEDMKRLLRFLIWRMRTLDGQKGTAEPLVNALHKREIDKAMNHVRQPNFQMPEQQRKELYQLCSYQVYQ